jgi:uncharacterized protein YjbI with pentapeptide repeats
MLGFSVFVAISARAEIYQWAYVNPADPSQGKRQSTTLVPDGSGAYAIRGADLSNRDLTMAHLIGADLTPLPWFPICSLCPPRQIISNLSGANLTDADLTSANLGGASLNGAILVGAQVRGTSFRAFRTISGSPIGGITLTQLYSTASYQDHDLSGIDLGSDFIPQLRSLQPNYAGGDFGGQNLSAASFSWTKLTDANFNQAILTNADFSLATLTGSNFIGAEIRGAHFANNDGTGITLEQLYSTGSYRAHDLNGVSLRHRDLTGANFAGQNLTNVSFASATLTGADFRGAVVHGASFDRYFEPAGGTGITLEQLYSTASYQARDLSGLILYGNDLSGANFAGQNLSNTSFHQATLTDVNFTDADVGGVKFDGSGITLPQLYSTASYQAHDLTGIGLSRNSLVGANLTGQNLTNASFSEALLTNADFTDADVRGASFAPDIDILFSNESGLTLVQLYSTASYQAGDLSGIGLAYHDLTGGNFAGQNLNHANLGGAKLSSANFHGSNVVNVSFSAHGGCGPFVCGTIYAMLTDADFTAADARGAIGLASDLINYSGATTVNLIWPDGHIDGLDLNADRMLVVRDYDGNPSYPNGDPIPPIPVTVDQHLTMGPGGTLRMVFEGDAWDSTISFAPGIPVTLGGTLELTFADDVNLASQVGRTFDLFDWTGVSPAGAFAIASPYTWDLSNLYATGVVTLISVPEPAIALIHWMPILILCARRQPKIS